MREIGGRAINLLTRIVLLGNYRDTQCGLKAFRSDVAQVIFGHSRIDGFAFDVEVFHLVEAYQLSLAEVPVRVVNSQPLDRARGVRRPAHRPRPVPGALAGRARAATTSTPDEVPLVARTPEG